MGTLYGTCDLKFFNCIASEVNRLAGMILYYYRLDKVATTRDPLYDEVSSPVFLNQPNGLKINAHGQKPEHSTTTGEEGRRTQWDTTIWLARIDWEKATGASVAPKIGDVVFAWNDYYDVIDSSSDGVMDDDTRVYTLYKLTVRRSSKYEAWRRTEAV